MPQTFRPNARIHTRVEFTAVQDHGRRVSGRFVTLVGRPNALGRDRLGIIASRKIGGAVVRNRAKRRLREIFRRETPDAMRQTIDLVAIARRELPGAPYADVEADVRNALRRLRSAIR